MVEGSERCFFFFLFGSRNLKKYFFCVGLKDRIVLIPKYFFLYRWPTLCWWNNRPAENKKRKMPCFRWGIWKYFFLSGSKKFENIFFFWVEESENIFFIWVEESENYFLFGAKGKLFLLIPKQFLFSFPWSLLSVDETIDQLMNNNNRPVEKQQQGFGHENASFGTKIIALELPSGESKRFFFFCLGRGISKIFFPVWVEESKNIFLFGLIWSESENIFFVWVEESKNIFFIWVEESENIFLFWGRGIWKYFCLGWRKLFPAWFRNILFHFHDLLSADETIDQPENTEQLKMTSRVDMCSASFGKGKSKMFFFFWFLRNLKIFFLFGSRNLKYFFLFGSRNFKNIFFFLFRSRNLKIFFCLRSRNLKIFFVWVEESEKYFCLGKRNCSCLIQEGQFCLISDDLLSADETIEHLEDLGQKVSIEGIRNEFFFVWVEESKKYFFCVWVEESRKNIFLFGLRKSENIFFVWIEEFENIFSFVWVEEFENIFVWGEGIVSLIPKHFVSFPWPTFCWWNNQPADEESTIDQLKKNSKDLVIENASCSTGQK